MVALGAPIALAGLGVVAAATGRSRLLWIVAMVNLGFVLVSWALKFAYAPSAALLVYAAIAVSLEDS